MNKTIEEYRKQFIKENLYERHYLPEDEAIKIRTNYELLNTDEYADVEFDSLGMPYRSTLTEVSDAELNQYALLKILETMNKQEQKVNTIRGIMVFWCILTVLNIIGTLIWLAQIYKIIKP